MHRSLTRSPCVWRHNCIIFPIENRSFAGVTSSWLRRARHCPARAQRCGERNGSHLHCRFASGTRSPDRLRLPADIPASLASRVRHERTLARRAPILARKICCDRHERCGAAASGAQVCRRTVCPDCATARKRPRQLRAAAAHARPIRLVNEIADGKIELDLASVISATRVSIHLLTRFSINHQLPGITGVCLLSMHTGYACPPDSSFPAPSFFFEGTG